MLKGKIKHVFPGGNTPQGFFSYYDYIIPSGEATRIFVIKGGPGVGKSTFMKKIGDVMASRGYDVEFHHCSSDNNSLDGVVIPALRVAFIDGTAPHRVVFTQETADKPLRWWFLNEVCIRLSPLSFVLVTRSGNYRALPHLPACFS